MDVPIWIVWTSTSIMDQSIYAICKSEELSTSFAEKAMKDYSSSTSLWEKDRHSQTWRERYTMKKVFITNNVMKTTFD